MSTQSLKKERITITLVGDGGVGKSSLTSSFIYQEFSESHIATIEDIHQTQIKIDNIDVELTICDTAGQDDFFSLRPEWIRKGDGFLLVYNTADDTQHSLYNLKDWIKMIERVKSDTNGAGPGYPIVPMVFVGNKCDLGKESISMDETRLFISKNVKLEKGDPKTKLPIIIETSAKNGTNVQDAFENIVRQVLMKRQRSLIPNKSQKKSQKRRLSGLFFSISELSDDDMN